jgi:hypothetical protein
MNSIEFERLMLVFKIVSGVVLKACVDPEFKRTAWSGVLVA